MAIEGPDDGHLITITATLRASSKVDGDAHHSDSDWTSEPWTLSVRAWSLAAAMRKAGDLPLSAWTPPYSDDDQDGR